MEIKFGKYKGKLFQEVYETDRSYCEWMIRSSMEKSQDPQWGQKNADRARQMQEEMDALDAMNGIESLVKNSGGSMPKIEKKDDLMAILVRIEHKLDTLIPPTTAKAPVITDPDEIELEE